jgi:hypothetical protein
MQSLDLSLIITVIFAFVMIAYWIGAFFILYHLIRFGVGSSPKKLAVLYLAGSLFLSIVMVLLYGQIHIPQL